MKLIESCEKKLESAFKRVDGVSYFNQLKVLKAFNKYNVATRHFNGSTVYGYVDEGRD